MTRARRAARRLLATPLLTACLLFPQASAETESGPPESSLFELLREFRAHHKPTSELEREAFFVEGLRKQAELDRLPQLTFTERLTWEGFQRLSFESELSTSVDLYSARTPALMEVQAARAARLRHEEAFSASNDAARFLKAALAATLLRHLTATAKAALAALDEAGFEAPRNLPGALDLPNDQRDLYLLYRQAEELRSLSADQAMEYERAAAISSNRSPPLQLPAFGELMQELTALFADAERCAAEPPAARSTRLSHELMEAEAHARRTVDAKVNLHATARYAEGAVGVLVGLAARLSLPTAAPLSGHFETTVNPTSLTQSVTVTWPKTVPLEKPSSHSELAAELAAELSEAKTTVRALANAVSATSNRHEEALLLLLYAARDATGATSKDTDELLSLLSSTELHPTTRLQLLGHKAELAAAQLAHAEAIIDHALHCGADWL